MGDSFRPGGNPPHTWLQSHGFGVGIGWGAFVATLLMLLFLGIREDLAEAVQLPMFWLKLAFTGTLVGASVLAAQRLSLPGVPLGWVPAALATPVFAMWCLAAFALARAERSEWPELLLGSMWAMCMVSIVLLSLPVLVGMFWALRRLSPARWRQAGAAAGLVAGSTAGLIFAFHCPDLGAPFIGSVYLLAMLIPVGLGALLAPFVLRR